LSKHQHYTISQSLLLNPGMVNYLN